MRRYKLETKEFSEINITPFTDVVLVLLIIFMIASPVIISGALDIKLPKASGSGESMSDKIQIALNVNREIFVNGEKVNETDLAPSLKAKDIVHSEVLIDADYRLTHGWVVHVIDLVKSAGAQKIAIGTGSEENF